MASMGDKPARAADLLRAKREGAWFAGGVRFRCTHPSCSACCTGARGPGYVWVTLDEMQAIAAHLGMQFESFTRKFIRQVEHRYSLVEKTNQDCILLEDGKCRAYAVRPTQCRTYPFWPEIMTSPQRWQREGTQCPGVEVDKTMVSGEQIERYLADEAAARP
jgi:hypothetical protein